MLHFDPLIDPPYEEVQAYSDLIEQSCFGYRYQLIWGKIHFYISLESLGIRPGNLDDPENPCS